MMKTLTVKIPNAVATKLATETRRRGVSTSEMVREAIAEYLVTTTLIKGKPHSFLELASDLCGCLSGPADLSTNPKYMEEYGK
jgi:hypothetical protein